MQGAAAEGEEESRPGWREKDSTTRQNKGPSAAAPMSPNPHLLIALENFLFYFIFLVFL